MTEPLSKNDQIHFAIESLKSELLKQHPMIPDLLNRVHKDCLMTPELVQILSEEELGVIVSAASKHTGIVILAEKVKASGTKAEKEKMKNWTPDLL